MGPLSPTDERLLQDFLAGHDAAYELLVMRHRADLMRTAAAILKQREDAEDVLQQALLKAYERAHQYRGEAPVRIWLRRLLVSSCMDHLRRRKVRAFLCPWEDRVTRLAAAQDDGTDAPLLHQELRARVDALLGRLPARQRTIFALRVFEDWPLTDIAASLGVDVGTVKTHLFRATHRVRAELQAAGVRSVPVSMVAEATLP